ncbi:hypothetical protein [Actinomadura madurae]|uniref:hypothetical protein n=1 Tax=Actinomadura madurae TaxID=1993 RepID=UPI000D80C237|nr:hypothetical protein [Actinomadura madurae]SPT64510.1 Uncharacterised protein [Actinomadura madurae]
MTDSDRKPGADELGQNALVAAEYVSLRAEIVKLIELQAQLVSLTVISTGAIMGAAVQVQSAGLAFVYPVLALILGISWLNHALAIGRAARYLSQDFEPRCGDGVLGWERFVRRNPLRFGMLGYWGVRSVFMGSSLVAVLIGWTLIEARAAQLAFGVLSTLISIVTFALFIAWREPSPRELFAEEHSADGSVVPEPRPPVGPARDHAST